MVIWSLIAAGLAIALVFVAAKVFSRWGEDDDAADGATAGHAGAMLSALFLLIFAIAIIIPWTVADSARQNTQAEAQSLVEAYWSAGDLPQPQRDEVRNELKSYTDFVIGKEWPIMQDDKKVSSDGWKQIDEFRARVKEMTFKDQGAEDAQADVVSSIKDIYAARRQRASDAESGLPVGVLLFTVVTGIIMIIYPFLAGARPKKMAYVPLLLMAALLGVSIYLVFNINHAFSGALGVPPDAYKTAVQEYARIP